MKKIWITPILVSTMTINAQTTKLQKKLAMEQNSIIETVSTIFSASDVREWSKVEKAFAPEVLLDYSSMTGGDAVRLSPAQITTAWKALLPGFQSTHHQVGGFQVSVDGNTAAVNFSGLALHYLPGAKGGDTWTAVGTYDCRLEKRAGEWKVNAMKFNLQKQQGNLQLPALAKENAAAGKRFTMAKASMASLQAVENFFSSLEKLDIPSFLHVWNEDGKQLMPLSPEGFPKELDGKEAVYNQYKGLPQNFLSMSFPRKVFATESPDKLIVQYAGSIPLKAGGRYDNNYVGIFEIKNGRIDRFTEYFDPFILARAFGIKLQDNFNVETAKPRMEKVSFVSEGLNLAGHLYLPAGYTPGKQYPALIVGGSWTTVKEQMSGLYAEKLAAQGYITLAFDPRNFGESEGAPRFYESPEMKIQDYRNAITYLVSRPEVDKERIGAVAVCASSGYLARVAAEDSRIKALSTIAAWLHDAEAVKMIYGGSEAVLDKIEAARKAKADFANNGIIAYIPSISKTDSTAAMFGDFDYYLNSSRGAVPQWGRQFAVMSWEDWLTFEPMTAAAKINQPVLMIHSDGAVLADYVRRFYRDLPNPGKELSWTEGSQFDFYDQPKQVNESVLTMTRFFSKHL
ncbi:MAG TPA: nuclear transport factor 2 family protein [Flavisolibacter sp.]|nr:nuclear transport factor 2 family protein [Flavisolibacter sp.]